MTTDKLLWRPIPGYRDYQVSNKGDVMSCKFGKKLILKCRINKDGYLQINLYKGGKRVTRVVHQLVLLAFTGNGIEGHDGVRHLDGNPQNNCITNLTYGTYGENQADKVKHGRLPNGERQGLSKLTAWDVVIIRQAYKEMKITQTELAKAFGIYYTNIHFVVTRKTWAHIP